MISSWKHSVLSSVSESQKLFWAF